MHSTIQQLYLMSRCIKLKTYFPPDSALQGLINCCVFLSAYVWKYTICATLPNEWGYFSVLADYKGLCLPLEWLFMKGHQEELNECLTWLCLGKFTSDQSNFFNCECKHRESIQHDRRPNVCGCSSLASSDCSAVEKFRGSASESCCQRVMILSLHHSLNYKRCIDRLEEITKLLWL